MSETAPIQSVVTTLTIVEIMAKSQSPLGVSELARAVNSTKPRIFRHLRTLLNQGYVMQDTATEKYLLTLKIFHLGQLVFEKAAFLSEARRVIPDLMAEIRQTITIGQVEASGIRIMDLLKCRSQIEITTPPGTLLDFHSSAQGKLALAFGPEDLWDKISKIALVAVTPKTITDIGALEKEIQSIKIRGWADAPEQALMGVNAFSAPVFDKDRALVGIITAVGSMQFLNPHTDVELRNSVLQAARRISLRLGYS